MVLTAAIAALPLYGCGAANTAPASDSAAEEAQVSGDAAAEAQTPVAAAEVTRDVGAGETCADDDRRVPFRRDQTTSGVVCPQVWKNWIKRPLG